MAAAAYQQDALSSQLVSAQHDMFYINVRIQYTQKTCIFKKNFIHIIPFPEVLL